MTTFLEVIAETGVGGAESASKVDPPTSLVTVCY
jgi:hypothetical protein